MILKAFIDESGVGGEDHCTVAAFVGRLGRWQHFDRRWAKLLSRHKHTPPYAHLYEMERKDPPFEAWDSRDIHEFFGKGFGLALKYAEFAITATVSSEDYSYYRENMPPKNSPDSQYGLCVRMVLDFICHHYRECSELREPRVNVIFDRGKRTSEAKAIFEEMKLGYNDASRILGDSSVGSIRNDYGIQITDYLVARARRIETTPEVDKVRHVTNTEDQAERVRSARKAPLFHISVREQMLELFLDEKPKLKSRLRYRRKKAKNARSSEKR